MKNYASYRQKIRQTMSDIETMNKESKSLKEISTIQEKFLLDKFRNEIVAAYRVLQKLDDELDNKNRADTKTWFKKT